MVHCSGWDLRDLTVGLSTSTFQPPGPRLVEHLEERNLQEEVESRAQMPGSNT